MKTQYKHSLITALAIITFSVFTGCTGGGGGDGSGDSSSESSTNTYTTPPSVEIEGTSLLCETGDPITVTDEQATVEYPDLPIQRINVSKDGTDDYNERPNAKNNLKRLSTIVDSNLTDTEVTYVHPMVVSYAEQVIGDYEMGDGSADIGDPYHIDDIFVSLSLDNGKTWKKVNVSNTAEKSSLQVNWTANKTAEPALDYPGHSHKPTMAVNGNHILVGWHDKYCPSGDPLDLFTENEDGTKTLNGEQTDYFKVNGAQGSINYELPCTLEDGSDCAPNGKPVFEVPFSCVWTARGVFEEDNNSITWYKPEQLTSGTRDANKLWIASAKDVGFAMSWQEDPEGLRQGLGAGPGEGWSGATTNHGADIWYTDLAQDLFWQVDEDFVEPEDAVVDAEDATKPKAENNFAYPVRISDNEVCIAGDTKEYCADFCSDTYINSKDEDAEDGAEDGTSSVGKCEINKDWEDMLSPDEPIVLDGDTGASRPALSILRTNEGENMVILAYEETKGLSESHQDEAAVDDDDGIADEGKVALFESFKFGEPVTVRPGFIVNVKAPDVNDSSTDIYENARRVVIVNQVDACEQGNNGYTFGIMYKQGIETRGGSSDMFVRMNTGFGWETFVADDFDEGGFGIPNLSSMPIYDKAVQTEAIESYWAPENLKDETYTNVVENTFSPRGFMRGEDIFIGFEYTPNWSQTERGNEPNTFYIHRYADDGDGRKWQGPMQISKISGDKVSTLDPRFVPTPKASYNAEKPIESDRSNPDVMFLTYGTFDMGSGDELDLFFSRSTDGGRTWYHRDQNTSEDATMDEKLAGIKGLEEMEVQSVASPDGKMLFNIWLQEEHEDNPIALVDDEGNTVDHFGGLDSWSGRVDFNSSDIIIVNPQ